LFVGLCPQDSSLCVYKYSKNPKKHEIQTLVVPHFG
jgi:hypothetical protein